MCLKKNKGSAAVYRKQAVIMRETRVFSKGTPLFFIKLNFIKL